MEAAKIFDRAHRAFQAGELKAAHADLLGLVKIVPNNVAVLHLLGLTEKGLGNRDLAKRRFELALQIAPDNAELLANAANLFAATGDAGASLSAYERAIQLAPNRTDFRLNRAISLLDLGMAERAVEDADFLLAQPQADARMATVAGQIYRAVKSFDAAVTAFRRALDTDPNRPTALAGLGELLLEEGAHGAPILLQQAYEAVPHDRGIALSLAEALEAEGRFDDAIALMDECTAKAPEWITGHSALARMRGEAGKSGDSSSGFERALTLLPQNANLWACYASYLRSNDAAAAALKVLDRAKKSIPFDITLSLIEAGIADDLGDTDRSAALLARVPDGYHAADGVRMRHLIRCGRPDEASHFAQSSLSQNPEDIALWALLSLCWRMTGDPQEAWLNPPFELFKAVDIGLPGNPVQLAETLRQLHVARHHPAGQSLRHGTQTRGSLFRRRNELIAGLRDHIRAAVSAFVSELPPTDPKHPLLRHRDAMLDFAGSWSVRLTQGGFHVSHIHPAGILSSAFYVSLPDNLGGQNDDGWLAIGDAPPELGTGLGPYAMIEPRVGRLVLFPSYLFHGTRPFGAGERLTVAFDIAPA